MTMGPESPKPIVRVCCSEAVVPMKPRRATGLASRWCMTPWRCTADRCASMARASAARVLSSRCRAGVVLRPDLRAFLDLEGDALGQRQFAAPVDGVGLASHVGLPRIRAGLASAAGVLLATKSAADLGAGSSDVHIGNAAVAARRGQERLGMLQPVGEDG